MSDSRSHDVVVIGSGPNGLSAAIVLARAGVSVRVIEAHETIGGGMRTEELTKPGFRHDVCSAVHPMGVLSPFFNNIPLTEHGLEWIHPSASVAHPLDDGSAVLLERSLSVTSDSLGPDGSAWRKLIEPFLADPAPFLQDLMAPLRPPKKPSTMTRFGFYALRPANHLARRFNDVRARALFAGCAAHSILPFSRVPSAAVALVLAITGHIIDWPVARGGSESVALALAGYLRSLGGTIETGRKIRSLSEIDEARVVLFDTSPKHLAEIAGPELPFSYVSKLKRYRYGPAAFKLDWALSGPIPWRDPECAKASTVHVGGTLEEISAGEDDAWYGRVPEKPFVLVCQQSHFDDTRAPSGQHTGYAYCHVPNACEEDMTDRIESQIERFAPGFRDVIIDRHARTPLEFERYNDNYVGGAITGGAANLSQLFTRPAARLNPYTTPNPRLFICSASTPPGGGVHGMCGYHAARTVIKHLGV